MKEEAKKKAERENKMEDGEPKKESKDEEDKEEKSDKQKPLPGNGGWADNYTWS